MLCQGFFWRFLVWAHALPGLVSRNRSLLSACGADLAEHTCLLCSDHWLHGEAATGSVAVNLGKEKEIPFAPGCAEARERSLSAAEYSRSGKRPQKWLGKMPSPWPHVGASASHARIDAGRRVLSVSGRSGNVTIKHDPCPT